MKDSRVQYIVNRWPLVELKMTRQDCVNYLLEHSLPLPPPLSCVGCPYKGAKRWLAATQDEFGQGVEFDELNRNNPLADHNVISPELYIWRDTRSNLGPLADADLATNAARERQQKPGFQLPLMCGAGACMV